MNSQQLMNLTAYELNSLSTQQLTNSRANPMKDITIHPQATIKEAMGSLDKIAEKVLFVVDENQALIGALTDGDILKG